jgi:hypothetical protein
MQTQPMLKSDQNQQKREEKLKKQHQEFPTTQLIKHAKSDPKFGIAFNIPQRLSNCKFQSFAGPTSLLLLLAATADNTMNLSFLFFYVMCTYKHNEIRIYTLILSVNFAIAKICICYIKRIRWSCITQQFASSPATKPKPKSFHHVVFLNAT